MPSLKYWRLERVLTQDDLARLSGVSRQTIGRGEGGAEIRISVIQRLARALKVNPNALTQPPPDHLLSH